MQHIAMLTLAAATFGTSLLLGWLWLMESRGSVPGWVKKMHDASGEQSDATLY